MAEVMSARRLHGQALPYVVSHDPREPCAHCEVRGRSVCDAIPDRDLARLAAAAVTRDFPRGRVFIEEGQPAVDFFNMTAGTAKLFKMMPDGRQQIVGFAGAGHFLGLAVADNYAFSAQAVEPVRVCRFSRVKLQSVIHDFPALEQRLLETACNELVTAQETMLLLGRKSASERVASFLISWARVSGTCGHPRDRVHLPMTRADIADHLGLTIETVSRTLTRFRNEKRIRVNDASEITILDRAGLEALAAGE